MGGHWRALRVGVIATDVVAIVAAHALSAGLRFGLPQFRLSGRLWPVYPILIVVVAALLIALATAHGTYRRWALLGGHRVYPILVTVATYGLVAIIFLSYFLGGSPLVSRTWLLASWGGTILLLCMSRLAWRQVALRWQRLGLIVRNVLIVGANQHGIAVAQQLSTPERHGRRVVGFLDDFRRPGTMVLPGLAVLGHPVNLLECATEAGAEEVIIITGALTWESQRLLAEMVTRPDFPLDARISPTFYDLLTTSAELSHVAYVPMLTLLRARLSGLNAAAKKALDVLVAGTLLMVLIPAWAYWRVLAWMRGVPMLKQIQVLGFEGRWFEVVGLSPGLTRSPVLARLPALWNVLWQDLSLVGPRPIREREVADHEQWLASLVAMRPGLTGLWRVQPGDLPVEERVALDIYYVRNYSLTLDGQILYNTARQLVRRLGGHRGELARWVRDVALAGEPTPTRATTPPAAAARAGVSPAAPAPMQAREDGSTMEVQR